MALTAAFQRFKDNAATQLPGALWTDIQAELFEALRDFMQNTNVWRGEYDVAVTNASNVYVLPIAASTGVKRLLNFYNSTDDCKRWFWPVTMATPGTLVLGRTVDQPYTLVATLALYALDPVDGDGNPTFPSWILDDYFDTLFSGMLYRMFIKPGKPWTNAALAATRYRMYKMGRGLALADITRENIYNGQSWAFPQAATVHGRQRV